MKSSQLTKLKVVKHLKKKQKTRPVIVKSSTTNAMRRLDSSNVKTVLSLLQEKDAVLSRMIRTIGAPLSLATRSNQDAFTSLVKSIVSQQLSNKAAGSIYKRVQDACGEEGGLLTPDAMLRKSHEELRKLGLSGRKCEYINDLAQRFKSGELADDKLKTMSNEEVMDALIKVRGLGEWSVHMFQIFHLGELDILPHGDLVVKKGAYALYGKGKSKTGTASKEDLIQIASNWKPFRSIGSW